MVTNWEIERKGVTLIISSDKYETIILNVADIIKIEAYHDGVPTITVTTQKFNQFKPLQFDIVSGDFELIKNLYNELNEHVRNRT